MLGSNETSSCRNRLVILAKTARVKMVQHSVLINEQQRGTLKVFRSTAQLEGEKNLPTVTVCLKQTTISDVSLTFCYYAEEVSSHSRESCQ